MIQQSAAAKQPLEVGTAERFERGGEGLAWTSSPQSQETDGDEFEEMLHIRPIYAPMTSAEADELQSTSPATRMALANASKAPNRRPSSAPPTRRDSKPSPPLPRTASDLTFLWRDDDTASVSRSSVSHYLRGGNTRLRRRGSTGSLLSVINPPPKKYHTKWYKEDPDKRTNLMRTGMRGPAWVQRTNEVDQRDEAIKGLKRSMSCGSMASVATFSTFRTRRGDYGGESTVFVDGQVLHNVGTRAHCPIHLIERQPESYEHVPSKMWWVEASHPLTPNGGGDRVSFEERGPAPWLETVPVKRVAAGSKMKRLPSYATMDASGAISLDAGQIFKDELDQQQATTRSSLSGKSPRSNASWRSARRATGFTNSSRSPPHTPGTPTADGQWSRDRSAFVTPNQRAQSFRESNSPELDYYHDSMRATTPRTDRIASQKKVRYSPETTSPRHYMSPTMSAEAKIMSRIEDDAAFARQHQRRGSGQQRSNPPTPKNHATSEASKMAPEPSRQTPLKRFPLQNEVVAELQKRLEEALLRVNPDIDPEEIRQYQRYVLG